LLPETTESISLVAWRLPIVYEKFGEASTFIGTRARDKSGEASFGDLGFIMRILRVSPEFRGFFVRESAWLPTRRSPDLQLDSRPVSRILSPASDVGRERGG
jgi:hypothetical protein